MADFTLSLGGVNFNDFEIPDAIKMSFGQATDTKKYGGGLRTVDAFGPDPEPITWSGMFLDGDAETRAQQLISMANAGSKVALSFSSFSFDVVVKKFDCDFERYYQIPYSITLEIVQDNTQPTTDDDVDPETDMQGDLDDTSGFSDDLGDTGGLSGAFATVTDAVTSMASITGGTVPQLTSLAAVVGSAQAVAESIADVADGNMDVLGQGTNFAASTDPDVMVSNLMAMAASANVLAPAFCAANSLTKLGKSVAAALNGG